MEHIQTIQVMGILLIVVAVLAIVNQKRIKAFFKEYGEFILAGIIAIIGTLAALFISAVLFAIQLLAIAFIILAVCTPVALLIKWIIS